MGSHTVYVKLNIVNLSLNTIESISLCIVTKKCIYRTKGKNTIIKVSIT